MKTKLVLAIILALTLAPAQALTHRSAAARNHFKSLQPCPLTQKPKGPCPGWVIDHVVALACGGADNWTNMQWQSVADGKAKDKWERKGCRITRILR